MLSKLSRYSTFSLVARQSVALEVQQLTSLYTISISSPPVYYVMSLAYHPTDLGGQFVRTADSVRVFSWCQARALVPQLGVQSGSWRLVHHSHGLMADIVGLISLPFELNRSNGPLTRALIGAPNQTMVGGPLSPAQYKEVGSRGTHHEVDHATHSPPTLPTDLGFALGRREAPPPPPRPHSVITMVGAGSSSSAPAEGRFTGSL